MSDVQITEANVHAFGDVPDRWLELTDKELLNSTFRSITIVGSVCGSLAYAFLNAGMVNPGRSSVTEWVTLTIMSLLPQAFFAGVTGFLAFMFLKTVNNALAKPMNLPAIAAIAGGLSMLTTIGIPLLTKYTVWNFGNSEAASMGIDTLLLVWLNAFVIQFAVRIWVNNKIEKHNRKPYALQYGCSACHIKFQIWQMMVFTTIIAALLACAGALGLTESIHVMIGSVLLLAIGTTYLPAKAAAEKLIPLPILDQDQIETQHEQNLEAKTALLDSEIYYVDSPVSTWRATFQGTSGIAIAGMHFAIVFTFMLTSASLFGSGDVNGVPPIFAIPGAFVGLILAGVGGLFVTFVLATLNAMFESMFKSRYFSAGNVAAVAGGLTGLACSVMVAESWEILHWSRYKGFYDVQNINNLFPASAILIATAMGQIYARVYVKRSLLSCRYRPEVATLTATGESGNLRVPARAGILTLLAVAAIVLLPTDLPHYSVSMLIVTIAGCMALVWPLGCWVARLVNRQWLLASDS